eukprot:GHVU01195767.1.p1 GENE.GHVU01195767.1~~GHVU01195767.1.p1  ORF type:complete len:444 (+),score=33.24 GHVU01195767.1:20-1351(+)
MNIRKCSFQTLTDEAELDAVLNEWRTQIIAQGLTEHHLKFMIARKGSHEIRELLKPFTPLHAYRTTDIINHVANKLLPRSNFHQECLSELMILTPLSSVRHALKVIRLTSDRLEVLRKRWNLGGPPADKQKVQWLFNKLPAAASTAIYKDAGKMSFDQLVEQLESGVLPNQTTGTMPITKWELRLTRPGHRPIQPDVIAFPLHPAPDKQPPPTALSDPLFAAAAQTTQWQHARPPFLQHPQRVPHEQPPYAQSPRYGQNSRSAQAVSPTNPTFTTGLGETYALCQRCQKNHLGSCWRCATCLITNCSHPIPPAMLCPNCGRVGHNAAACLNTTHTMQTQVGPVSVVVFTTPRTHHSVVRPHQRSANQQLDWAQIIDQAAAIRLHEAELASRIPQQQQPTPRRSPATHPNTYPSPRPLLVHPPQTAAPTQPPANLSPPATLPQR